MTSPFFFLYTLKDTYMSNTTYSLLPVTRIAPPSAEQKEHLRTVRKRVGFPGAGYVFVSAQNLPEDMPRPEKQREPVLWEPEENGAVALDLSRFA